MHTHTSPSNGRRHARLLALASASVLAAAATLGACTAKSSGEAVKVTSTNSACALSTATVATGRTTFDVTNEGSDVAEVYVYAAGNRIMGEVENIGPGSTRSFTADLGGGDYEVACKPGQKGDGIRTALHVTGSAIAAAEPSRTVQVSATEWSFTGLSSLQPKKGETIEFVLTNNGTVDHEMEVLDPAGDAVGEIGPTAPGRTGSVVITFNETGTWEFECGIAGHAEHGMKQTVDVVG